MPFVKGILAQRTHEGRDRLQTAKAARNSPSLLGKNDPRRAGAGGLTSSSRSSTLIFCEPSRIAADSSVPRRNAIVIHVGSRFRVSSYHDPALSPHDLHILIRPSPAFGDGAHPTTQMCLEMLELEITGGECVLDLGTGSGILAIAAARLGACRVIAADIERTSCQAALTNIRLNRLEQTVHVFEGSAEALHPEKTFDLVVANLYNAQQVIEVLPELTRRVRVHGTIMCGGIWTGRREEMMHLLENESFTFRNQQIREQLLTISAVKEL